MTEWSRRVWMGGTGCTAVSPNWTRCSNMSVSKSPRGTRTPCVAGQWFIFALHHLLVSCIRWQWKMLDSEGELGKGQSVKLFSSHFEQNFNSILWKADPSVAVIPESDEQQRLKEPSSSGRDSIKHGEQRKLTGTNRPSGLQLLQYQKTQVWEELSEAIEQDF